MSTPVFARSDDDLLRLVAECTENAFLDPATVFSAGQRAWTWRRLDNQIAALLADDGGATRRADPTRPSPPYRRARSTGR